VQTLDPAPVAPPAWSRREHRGSSSTLALTDDPHKVEGLEIDAVSKQVQHPDDTWFPSAEDILDSTTNHARPSAPWNACGV